MPGNRLLPNCRGGNERGSTNECHFMAQPAVLAHLSTSMVALGTGRTGGHSGDLYVDTSRSGAISAACPILMAPSALDLASMQDGPACAISTNHSAEWLQAF